MKTKIKARRYLTLKDWRKRRFSLTLYPYHAGHPGAPVAVIDVSDEAALIEQVAKVLYGHDASWEGCPGDYDPYVIDASAVLESLGILAKPRGIIKQRIPSRSRKAGK
jgi:hypothetical protein